MLGCAADDERCNGLVDISPTICMFSSLGLRVSAPFEGLTFATPPEWAVAFCFELGERVWFRLGCNGGLGAANRLVSDALTASNAITRS